MSQLTHGRGHYPPAADPETNAELMSVRGGFEIETLRTRRISSETVADEPTADVTLIGESI
jgi:hypothetical protein